MVSILPFGIWLGKQLGFQFINCLAVHFGKGYGYMRQACLPLTITHQTRSSPNLPKKQRRFGGQDSAGSKWLLDKESGGI